MFDHLNFINSILYSPEFTESIALYFVAVPQSSGGWMFFKYSGSRAKPYVRVINESAGVKCSGPESVFKAPNMCIRPDFHY